MNDRTDSRAPSTRSLTLAWLALLLLLALTCGSAFIPMGAWNLVSNFAIAVIKAAIVLVLFMDLRGSAGTVRAVAITGVIVLTLLVGLSMTDLALRSG